MNVDDWLRANNWKAFDFQRETWAHQKAGRNGLVHASTGTGKTYAAYLGIIDLALSEEQSKSPPTLRVLWLTPLRALSRDTAQALEKPLSPLGLNWSVGIRTGDTSTSQRAKQMKKLPSVLVTTPESLALILTKEEMKSQFDQLRLVVIDEWHELLSSKRGVMIELLLARLRRRNPDLMTWGLSATLGNIPIALKSLLGPNLEGVIVKGNVPKTTIIDCILPSNVERFPWAGHLGLTLVEEAAKAIDEAKQTLVFTNTRAQCELWYQSLLQVRPQWAGLMAIHHGSLDRKVRDWVEQKLRDGELKCCVCTSSMDLGVDFRPVDRVIQIGSPKGVARLLQRAGRSGHQPGRASRVTCLPTNAFELIEMAAARNAAEAGTIEPREPYHKPLDLLAQHAVSCALAGGFDERELFDEVRTTAAYDDLTREEWQWVLDFIVRGGEPLRVYPEFRRVVIDDDGRYRVNDRKVALRHRLSIGTIAADASVIVKFARGGKLGTVEENFVAKLNSGDRFTFAGRTLEFVQLHEMMAIVKPTKKPPNTVPRWMGGRMPLSSELSFAVREELHRAKLGRFASEELRTVKPILDTQARRSAVPGPKELLIERLRTREGYHVFIYPFEGRLVHEGLCALIAYRVSLWKPLTLSLAVNDYGFELLCHEPLDLTAERFRDLLSPERLSEDILASLNTAELAKRQFREVARIAGLVFPGMPSAGKSAKQLQMSAGLFYRVFCEYDPDNLLLHQSRQEVLDRQFERKRMTEALERIRTMEIVLVDLEKPTPLGFPLLVDRLRGSLTSEKLADRVKRMIAELERSEA